MKRGGGTSLVEECAQIFPVLLVALLADPTVRSRRDLGVANSVRLIVGLTAAVTGEAAALWAIEHNPTHWINVLVITSLLILSYLIMRPYLAHHLKSIFRATSGAVGRAANERARWLLRRLAIHSSILWYLLHVAPQLSSVSRSMLYIICLSSIPLTLWKVFGVFVRGARPEEVPTLLIVL